MHYIQKKRTCFYFLARLTGISVIRLKIIDFITSSLLLIFPKISGNFRKFSKKLNFRKIYNPTGYTAPSRHLRPVCCHSYFCLLEDFASEKHFINYCHLASLLHTIIYFESAFNATILSQIIALLSAACTVAAGGDHWQLCLIINEENLIKVQHANDWCIHG